MKRTLLAGMLALLMCFGVLSFAGCGGDPEQLETVRIIAHSEMEDVLEPFFQKFMAENEDIRIEVLYGVDQLDQMDKSWSQLEMMGIEEWQKGGKQNGQHI